MKIVLSFPNSIEWFYTTAILDFEFEKAIPRQRADLEGLGITTGRNDAPIVYASGAGTALVFGQ
jgi:hypothetical protein